MCGLSHVGTKIRLEIDDSPTRLGIVAEDEVGNALDEPSIIFPADERYFSVQMRGLSRPFQERMTERRRDGVRRGRDLRLGVSEEPAQAGGDRRDLGGVGGKGAPRQDLVGERSETLPGGTMRVPSLDRQDGDVGRAFHVRRLGLDQPGHARDATRRRGRGLEDARAPTLPLGVLARADARLFARIGLEESNGA